VPNRLRLYHYWRSSSSWRVRWGLALKRLPCEMIAVNLLSEEAECAEHLARNPLGYVPVLELVGIHEPERFLTESLAILEWLDEVYPHVPLLPNDTLLRARTRQLAEIINSATQPLQNPNVAERHSSDPEERKRWNQHWIRRGLDAYSRFAASTAGKFSVGDSVTLADLCLIPQLYGARRNEIAVEDYPLLKRIEDAALATEACHASHPDRFQPS